MLSKNERSADGRHLIPGTLEAPFIILLGVVSKDISAIEGTLDQAHGYDAGAVDCPYSCSKLLGQLTGPLRKGRCRKFLGNEQRYCYKKEEHGCA